MVLDIGSIFVNDLNEIDISIEIKRSWHLVFFREQKTIKTLKTLKCWVLSVLKYINWNNWKCCGIFSYWSLLQHIRCIYVTFTYTCFELYITCNVHARRWQSANLSNPWMIYWDYSVLGRKRKNKVHEWQYKTNYHTYNSWSHSAIQWQRSHRFG